MKAATLYSAVSVRCIIRNHRSCWLAKNLLFSRLLFICKLFKLFQMLKKKQQPQSMPLAYRLRFHLFKCFLFASQNGETVRIRRIPYRHAVINFRSLHFLHCIKQQYLNLHSHGDSFRTKYWLYPVPQHNVLQLLASEEFLLHIL